MLKYPSVVNCSSSDRKRSTWIDCCTVSCSVLCIRNERPYKSWFIQVLMFARSPSLCSVDTTDLRTWKSRWDCSLSTSTPHLVGHAVLPEWWSTLLAWLQIWASLQLVWDPTFSTLSNSAHSQFKILTCNCGGTGPGYYLLSRVACLDYSEHILCRNLSKHDVQL